MLRRDGQIGFVQRGKPAKTVREPRGRSHRCGSVQRAIQKDIKKRRPLRSFSYGPLHLGALVTAVASFLHARQARGEWLSASKTSTRRARLRSCGADPADARSLRARVGFGPSSSSSRLAAYEAVADRLLGRRPRVPLPLLAQRDSLCQRRRIRRYPGTCHNRHLAPGDAAVRVVYDAGPVIFDDRLQGPIETDLAASLGDYVVVRRDGLPAYHLAVVLDDARQGVTERRTRRRSARLDRGPRPPSRRARSRDAAVLTTSPFVVNELGQKALEANGSGCRRRARWYGRGKRYRAARAPSASRARRRAPSALWHSALERWRIDSLRAQRALAMRAA